jgi:hypothetical protein
MRAAVALWRSETPESGRCPGFAEQLPLDLHRSIDRMKGLAIRRRIWSSAAEVSDIPARVSIGETISLILKGSEMSSKAVCSGGSNYQF